MCNKHRTTPIFPITFIVCGLIISLFFLVTPVLAAVVINEFSSGSTSDWVEFYNTGTTSAGLAAYRLRDSGPNSKDLSETLAPGDFKSFSFSNSLNNLGDIVKLFIVEGSTETLVDQITYGDVGGLCAPEDVGSIGRSPDGGSNIKRFAENSRDQTNNNSAEAPCPTSTPAPSPTLTPTLTPTNTNTPTSTNAPTSSPTPTRTPTPTKKTTPTISPSPTEAEVLGATESTSSPTPTSEVPAETKVAGWQRPMAIASAFIGTGLALLAGLFIWQKRKAVSNEQ